MKGLSLIKANFSTFSIEMYHYEVHNESGGIRVYLESFQIFTPPNWGIN